MKRLHAYPLIAALAAAFTLPALAVDQQTTRQQDRQQLTTPTQDRLQTQDQLHTQDRLQTQDQLQTQDRTQTRDQVRDQTATKDGQMVQQRQQKRMQKHLNDGATRPRSGK